MSNSKLILILGDQLSWSNPALIAADPKTDGIILAEVREEASYVPHNRHKLVLIFSAMRHFAQCLRERGFTVYYTEISAGLASLEDACSQTLQQHPAKSIEVCSPGEHRLLVAMGEWSQRLGVTVNLLEDTRFLASDADFSAWAKGRKQLRMEYFYREMRKRYRLLLDDGEPCGGQWNYDADNRKGWRNQVTIPAREDVAPDAITEKVVAEVLKYFPNNPGDLSQFRLAVTYEAAQRQFDWFCRHTLADFGNFHDALPESPPGYFIASFRCI